MTIRVSYLLIALALLLTSCETKESRLILTAPAENEFTEIFNDGTAILPNGRYVTPLGKLISTAPHPYGLVISPDGKYVATANSGTNPLSVTIISEYTSDQPLALQIPEGAKTDKGILAAVYMGIGFSPDNETLYVSGGQEGVIYKFNPATGEALGAIDCLDDRAGRSVNHAYLGDLTLNKDGSRLYIVDQIQFELLVIDTKSEKVVNTVPTGRYPFGVSLSPDEKEIHIANVGVFEYKPFEGLEMDRLKEQAAEYPPFGYNTKEMREGVDLDSLKVPGLGDPNVPESFSVWTVALTDSPRVVSKIKTGFLVGELVDGVPAVGGASPNSLVTTDSLLFVSNGNNDCISVINTRQGKVIKNIFLKPHASVSKYRGVIPFGLALSPDMKRLYVAESGINAVGVINVSSLEVLGHLPAGWFPSKLQVTPDGRHLLVANAKGFGSGPNAGPNFERGPEGSYVGNLMKGTVSVLDIPEDSELQKHTEKVISNNFLISPASADRFNWRKTNPVPLYPGEKETPIKHIVFISKENRTYDEVFGQVRNGRGLPELARFGRGRTITSNRGDTVHNVDVMINHQLLAERFGIADNFYCDSDHSADGHRWLVNTYPNEWVETSVTAAYGGNRNMRADSDAPGNLAFVGATGAIYPEDYNEAGSIWEHFDRNGISFFNFGFGLELAPSLGDLAFKYTGVRYVVNYPVPEPIFERSSKKYATYNMGIPDQFRVDMFFEEFRERWLGEGKMLPQTLTILLPNDHGAGERPDAGYPFFESYMMDNDLALGRIVEFLSHTPYWKNMAIVVTEDDPQGGVDHVDAHRSLLMVISPYAKRGHVSSVHYSFGSIFKTFWNILGIPYLNQYDAGASDLAEFFTGEPDFTPYTALLGDTAVFNPQNVLTPFDEKFDWDAFLNSPELDHPAVMQQQNEEYEAKRAE